MESRIGTELGEHQHLQDKQRREARKAVWEAAPRRGRREASREWQVKLDAEGQMRTGFVNKEASGNLQETGRARRCRLRSVWEVRKQRLFQSMRS